MDIGKIVKILEVRPEPFALPAIAPHEPTPQPAPTPAEPLVPA